MKDTAQGLIETPGDLMEVLQGEFAFIQLTVGKDLVDYLLNRSLNSCRGGVP